ncbi:ferrous iron transport protein B [Clostridium baratii]|uniref:ferrous iron transport protein B n=1 Tax=Clostridium baratii TaxID=1561 RepID=UPI001C01806F|nr:ferrous iron transport protein B [Clostridium baratii]MBT9831217.1 ferrous iron transport protein B [Clostridium baratii]
MRIALAGNPNCGKSSIFNVLTKGRQHIGNWPGVTVEKKEGKLKHKGNEYSVIDLPGTYSLGAYSEDEVVARDYILKEKPEVVINVVDASNIERNLYLTVQLLELGTNVVLALNMMDSAKSKGIHIDSDELSKRLGIPVIETVATKKEGIDKLIEEALKVQGNPKKNINLSKKIVENIDIIKEKIDSKENLDYSSEWISLKLLENDSSIKKYLEEKGFKEIVDYTESVIDKYTESEGLEPEMAIVDDRYSHISKVIKGIIDKPSKSNKTLSDKIDNVVTNKFLGIPIFAIIMYLLYAITFKIGGGLQEWVGELIDSLGGVVVGWLEGLGAPEFLTGFVGDGIFAGVGAVITFVPLIMVMYFLMGLLEDSGYMARAAYIMDRVMKALGLHGKTFISMIIGSGCNVPGIMSTRTLESKKDRMIAILINPFVSCGARLPIYLVFIDAFFQTHAAIILLSLYLLGIIVALIYGKILSKTLFKGETSYFVMELPSYRVPSIKNVALLTWEKGGAFIKKAGIVIFPAVVVIWLLSVLPFGVEQYSEASILGRIGTFIAPIYALAGFATWQASVALFSGIIAKETVVATLGMLYAGVAEGSELITSIAAHFTPLSAISYMTMTLLFTPCLAALGAIKRETNSTKWTLFSAIGSFVVALIVSTIVYQVGLLLGFN